jgi:hypothetical protein
MRTLGLPSRQVRRITVGELLPPVLVTAVAADVLLGSSLRRRERLGQVLRTGGQAVG